MALAYLYPVDDAEGRYGFQWGPVRVVRLAHDDRRGYLLIIQTEHDEVEVTVSPKGRRISVRPTPPTTTPAARSEEGS